MVSRISGGSCSQGPWKEEIYRQCLFECYLIDPADQSKSTGRTYLFRQMTRVGVDGSDAVVCGAIGGEVGPLAGVMLEFGLECPLGASSVTTLAAEAFDAFFLAISYTVSLDVYLQQERKNGAPHIFWEDMWVVERIEKIFGFHLTRLEMRFGRIHRL